MYSILGHSNMIRDYARTDAYARALRRCIRPGTTVLDLGCGTGLFALLACRFGARKVYAIESDDVIQVAAELAEANGFKDRIRFFQANSMDVELPERVDVVVSDIRGVVPLFSHHISSILDARARFLAKDGLLIPRMDVLHVSLVDAPNEYKSLVQVWEDRAYGLNLSRAGSIASNHWIRTSASEDQLLLEPREWLRLDYATVESPDAAGSAVWRATKPATSHGLLLWFGAQLLDEIEYEAGPRSKPDSVYGSAFFPFPHPVSFTAGDSIRVFLEAKLVGDDYIWQWETEVKSRRGRCKASYTQSSFLGVPLSPATLRKKSALFRPELNDEARVQSYVLRRMNGDRTLAELADSVLKRFPKRFRDRKAALAYVAEISVKLGR